MYDGGQGSNQVLQGLGPGTVKVAGTRDSPFSLLSLASPIWHLYPLFSSFHTLPLSLRGRKWLSHNSQALYHHILGPVPGKEIVSGSAKAKDQGPMAYKSHLP